MRAYINDSLRAAISYVILYFGLLACGWQRVRLLAFNLNQRRLRRKYGITRDTPVLSYGPEVEQSIRAKAGKDAKFATTSGTTGKPKELLYTNRRLLALKFAFSEMFAGACYAFRLKRTSLYVFSSFETDTSLTSLLLNETALPHYLSTLQAPYRIQHHPSIQTLVSKYGPTDVRLWLLTLSNPGVLYSTNPSTISTFLDELERDWNHSSALRRRTLEYSFTGEKLTAEQLSIVFDQLRASYPSLLADTFLTCVPSRPPHYKVLIVGDSNVENSHEFLAARCDELLCEINCEYRSKRASGRLGPVEVAGTKFEDFVALNSNWETQFKFLPLIMSSFELEFRTPVP